MMRVTSITLSLFFALFSPAVFSQGMMVLGGNSYAVECFQQARLAAGANKMAAGGVEFCDHALQYGSLKRGDRVATLVNRGIVHAALGRLDRAAADYASALKLDDQLPEVYLNRGNLWFLVQYFQEAIDEYNMALELKLPQAEIAYLNRGMAFENLGMLQNAEEDYLRSLEIQPDWGFALEKLERVRDRRARQ